MNLHIYICIYIHTYIFPEAYVANQRFVDSCNNNVNFDNLFLNPRARARERVCSCVRARVRARVRVCV